MMANFLSDELTANNEKSILHGLLQTVLQIFSRFRGQHIFSTRFQTSIRDAKHAIFANANGTIF